MVERRQDAVPAGGGLGVRPLHEKNLPSWDKTEAGLENLAAAHNGRLLPLDELARASADDREIAK
jgi:uncharacterized protein (DUF927 family)